MGKQDHYASAYGSFNVLTFLPDEEVVIEPVFYRPEVKVALEKHLMLFYTALKRDASAVLQSQEKSTEAKRDVLGRMKEQVGRSARSSPAGEICTSSARYSMTVGC